MILCPKLSYKIDSVIFLTSIMIIIPLSVSLSIEKESKLQNIPLGNPPLLCSFICRGLVF